MLTLRSFLSLAANKFHYNPVSFVRGVEMTLVTFESHSGLCQQVHALTLVLGRRNAARCDHAIIPFNLLSLCVLVERFLAPKIARRMWTFAARNVQNARHTTCIT